MKNVKKIGALVLALVMVLAMGTTAFAADDQTGTLANNGVVKNADHSSVGTTLNIPKGITVYGSLDRVYGPTVTYTYSIEPASVTSGAKVTDFNNVEHIVEAGPTGSASLTDSNAAFTSSEVTLTSGNAEITDNITVSIDTSKFNKPGIYRYKISDTTTTSTLYAAGITRPDDYITDRYLDVYVKYNTAETSFEVYGYVLTDANNTAIEGTDDQPLSWVTPTSKSSGYIATSETTKGTDEYHTVDVKVTKKVTGAMGDKTHEFPFTIAVSNSSLHYYSGEVASTPSAVSALTDGAATSVSASLKDNETFYIYGLNPKATVAYTEKNNTPDIYKLTVTGDDNSKIKDASDANIDAVAVSVLNGTKATAELKVSNYDSANTTTSVKATVTADAANKAVTFTNNLEEISPTGVVLRVAPYALILAAGVILLMLSKKRRPVED